MVAKVLLFVAVALPALAAKFSPENSTAAGPGLEDGKTGATTFTVTTRDSNGEQKYFYNTTVAATVSLADVEAPVPEDRMDGTYVFSYNFTRTGTAAIVVTVNGTQIQGSPFGPTIEAGPVDPAMSSASGSTESATLNEVNRVFVTAKDTFGNPNTDNDTALVYSLFANGSIPVNISDTGGDGAWTLTFTPESELEHTLNIWLNGQNISGSPFTFRPSESSSSTNLGVILGAVVGSVFLIILIFFCCRNKKTNSNDYSAM